MANLEGTVYLVLQRKAFPQSSKDALSPKRASTNKPEHVDAGQVAVRFRVSIPAEAFEPLNATDLVVVPPENVVRSAVVDTEPVD